jgi:aspartate--ammonia ligase
MAAFLNVETLKDRESTIWRVKECFQNALEQELNIIRVSAPLILPAGKGINDDLNGIERKAAFPVKQMNDQIFELPQSLAKWKRTALKRYGMQPGEGLWAYMNAIRPDEDIDTIHSVYVDQYDWEKVVTVENRNVEYLQDTVRKIYRAMKTAEAEVEKLCGIAPILPDEITFIHTTEMEQRWPALTPKQREAEVCKEYGAVFVMGIGNPLSNGVPHDGRAPDYDDWYTPTPLGPGLNGDILVWNPVLNREFELSSMGIRVDKTSLMAQLQIRGCLERKDLEFHQGILNDTWPLTMGGGVGQARLMMFLLRRAHVGETVRTIWPEDIIEDCRSRGILLL